MSATRLFKTPPESFGLTIGLQVMKNSAPREFSPPQTPRLKRYPNEVSEDEPVKDDEELDRLRTSLLHAYERPQPLPHRLAQAVRDRIGLAKKGSGKKKPRAAQLTVFPTLGGPVFAPPQIVLHPSMCQVQERRRRFGAVIREKRHTRSGGAIIASANLIVRTSDLPPPT
jgi:hypothetical protein